MFSFENAKPCLYSSFIVKNFPTSIFFLLCTDSHPESDCQSRKHLMVCLKLPSRVQYLKYSSIWQSEFNIVFIGRRKTLMWSDYVDRGRRLFPPKALLAAERCQTHPETSVSIFLYIFLRG